MSQYRDYRRKAEQEAKKTKKKLIDEGGCGDYIKFISNIF